MSARYTVEQFEHMAHEVTREYMTSKRETDLLAAMLRQAASDLAERDRNAESLKMIDDFLGLGGICDGAFTVGVLQAMQAEREAAQGRTCETCQHAEPPFAEGWRACLWLSGVSVPLMVNGQPMRCAGWAAKETP